MIKYQARFGGSEGLFMHCRVFMCDTDERYRVGKAADGRRTFGALERRPKSDASHFSGR